MGYYIGIVLIGILAGYIAGKLIKGQGFGILINLVLGVAGAFLGGFLFRLLGVHITNSLLGSLLTATIGAVVVLWIVNLLKRSI